MLSYSKSSSITLSYEAPSISVDTLGHNVNRDGLIYLHLELSSDFIIDRLNVALFGLILVLFGYEFRLFILLVGTLRMGFKVVTPAKSRDKLAKFLCLGLLIFIALSSLGSLYLGS